MQNNSKKDGGFNQNMSVLCSISDSNDVFANRQISYLDFMHNQIHFFNKEEELDISHIQPKTVINQIYDDHLQQKIKRKQSFKQSQFQRQMTFSIDTIYLQKMAIQTIIPNVNQNFKLQKNNHCHTFSQKQINLAIKIIVSRLKKLIFNHYSLRFFNNLKNNLINKNEQWRGSFQPQIKNISADSKLNGLYQLGLQKVNKIIYKRVIIQLAKVFSVLQLNSKSNLYSNFVSVFLITTNKLMKKMQYRALSYGFDQIKSFYERDIQQLKQMKKLFQNSKKYLQQKWPKLKNSEKTIKKQNYAISRMIHGKLAQIQYQNKLIQIAYIFSFKHVIKGTQNKSCTYLRYKHQSFQDIDNVSLIDYEEYFRYFFD